MFWFAGLVGMAMESRRFRNWLAASALGPVHSRNVSEPSSYRGSFNPFPALVIGVTGAAMSAHAQTYLFQVSRRLFGANYVQLRRYLPRCKFINSGGGFYSDFLC